MSREPSTCWRRPWIAALAVALSGSCVQRRDPPSGCVDAFERDRRYAAVRVFDARAFEAMRAEAVAMRGVGTACRDALDVQLAPLLRPVVARAFHAAPDVAVVAYAQAEVARAQALSEADPAACVKVLEGAGRMTDGELAAALARLPHDARSASDAADADLLMAARSVGTRSPAFSARETYEAGRSFQPSPDLAMAVNPDAPLPDRCRADLHGYANVMGVADPTRARMLRYARDSIVDHPPDESRGSAESSSRPRQTTVDQ